MLIIDSLTPATPSSESNLSPSPKKPTPAHTPGDVASPFESSSLDGLPPSSPPESQPLSFPDVSAKQLNPFERYQMSRFKSVKSALSSLW